MKTKQFGSPRYLGDPLNIIRIFNEKEVDEIVLLDILASKEGRQPNFELLQKISGQCFMPIAYGGGINEMAQAEKLFRLGFEKIVLNSALITHPALVTEVAKRYGSQSVVASIDAKKKLFGQYEAKTHSGTRATNIDPVSLAQQAVELGAGEIFINSIDRDGMMQGYDLELVKRVASTVSVPVVACGGAGVLSHLVEVVREAKASAVAAGSFFVYQGVHRAVLISAPTPAEITRAFGPR